MLDQSDEDRHCRILLLPARKSFNRRDSAEILKGHVDSQSSGPVDEFDEWDSSVGNNLDRVKLGNSLSHEKLAELVQPASSAEVRGRAASHEAGGAYDHVHVGSWEIEARHEGAKREKLSAGKVAVIPLHGLSQVVHQAVTNRLLKVTRLDKVVEIHDFLVQTEAEWLTYEIRSRHLSRVSKQYEQAYRKGMSVVAEWSTVAHGQGSSCDFGAQFGTKSPLDGFMFAFLSWP